MASFRFLELKQKPALKRVSLVQELEFLQRVSLVASYEGSNFLRALRIRVFALLCAHLLSQVIIPDQHIGKASSLL